MEKQIDGDVKKSERKMKKKKKKKINDRRWQWPVGFRH